MPAARASRMRRAGLLLMRLATYDMAYFYCKIFLLSYRIFLLYCQLSIAACGVSSSLNRSVVCLFLPLPLTWSHV